VYLKISAFLTAFRSKSSSEKYEWDMYLPFTDAMNYALEQLSDIEVDGLPGFETHIAFVPCDKGVKSDNDVSRSSYKPDIAVMSLQDACEFHQLETTKPMLSEFITKITGKSPSGITNWKTVLSAVEVKRNKKTVRPESGESNVQGGVEEGLSETPYNSQLSTCKINAFS
jgi:hypothetical protein